MQLTFLFMLFTLSYIEYQQTKTKIKLRHLFPLTYAAKRLGYYKSGKIQAQLKINFIGVIFLNLQKYLFSFNIPAPVSAVSSPKRVNMCRNHIKSIGAQQNLKFIP